MKKAVSGTEVDIIDGILSVHDGLLLYWLASDNLRSWKGAHKDVCDENESVFSKVLPHLQRNGMTLEISEKIKKKKERKCQVIKCQILIFDKSQILLLSAHSFIYYKR
jgi:hypothetical protein